MLIPGGGPTNGSGWDLRTTVTLIRAPLPHLGLLTPVKVVSPRPSVKKKTGSSQLRRVPPVFFWTARRSGTFLRANQEPRLRGGDHHGCPDSRVGSHDVRRTTTTIGANVVPGRALTRHAAKTMTGKRYVVHDLDKLRRPAQILADEIDRIANLELPIAITITRDQLYILLGALKGKEKALAVLRDSIPDLEDAIGGTQTVAGSHR